MTNDSEIKSVMSMGENLMEMKPKYRNMENPFLMKKGPIYDSEMERVERALKEVKERMNILPAGTLRNMKPPNVTEAIELAKKELKERAVIVEDATKIVEQIMSLPEKAREAWNVKGMGEKSGLDNPYFEPSNNRRGGDVLLS